jgi:hypothetical protein
MSLTKLGFLVTQSIPSFGASENVAEKRRLATQLSLASYAVTPYTCQSAMTSPLGGVAK